MDTNISDYTLEFVHADWEERYLEEVAADKAIIITNKECLNQRTMEATEDGLFAKDFGYALDTDEEIREYSCDCGPKNWGKFDEGERCDDCGSIVQMQFGTPLSRVGWIDIAPYSIIVPGMYQKIEKFIGPKRFREMVAYDCDIDVDGHFLKKEIDPRRPFKNIGIIEFRRRFDEIVEYFAKASKNNYLTPVFLDFKDSVFSSKIPVITPLLRPAYTSTRNRQFNFHDMNTNYTQILTDFNLIRSGKRSGHKAVEIMSNIQEYAANIYNSINTRINGKGRLVREEVLSKRVTFSSRHVIISKVDNTSNLDAMNISYKGFLGLYKLEILNCMRRGIGSLKFMDMTHFEAYQYLRKCEYSSEIDVDIYNIMLKLAGRKEKLWLLVNRNPTFDLGSIQCLYIDKVLDNAQDLVAALPISSLVGFNADFDGDVLNLFSVKERSIINAFRNAFSPRKLILDRTGGNYFNPSMSMIKDRLTNLNMFLDTKWKPADNPKLTENLAPEEKAEKFMGDYKKFLQSKKMIDSGLVGKSGVSIYDIEESREKSDKDITDRISIELGDYWRAGSDHDLIPEVYSNDKLFYDNWEEVEEPKLQLVK